MFKLIKREEIKNLEIEVFEFEHTKTKAKHVHIKADDDEKGFVVGFKTLPDTDNGVMHILEHCVLQGSRDFPLKDPFVSIMKNSLQTYLNAATSTDHTYYPFATQNKKDYFNLMHVYTNAAFFPLLKRETFLQEGWRYEFKEPQNPKTDLTVTGVVFNEMIGTMGNVYRHVWENMVKTLYPDTKYAYNSGGVPANIPELSYEEFCDYHKTYYHPSNATFLTYGDIDYSEIQEKIEEYVLNEFESKDITIENPLQQHFTQTKNVSIEYPYKEADFDEKHFYLKLWHISDITNSNDSYTLDFLTSLLAGDSSSVMLKAIEDSKLATTPVCYSDDSGRDLFLAIGGEGVKQENFEALDTLIKNTLDEIIANGFDKQQIAKEIHQAELAMKTKSAGHSTYGLNLLITVFDGMNHGVEPTVFLKPELALENLKNNIAKDDKFFSKFMQEKFVENTHSANLQMLASNNAAKLEDEELANLAKAKEATLTDEDVKQILADNIALDAYQAQDDEGIELPEFSIKDIPLEKEIQALETLEHNGKTVYAFKAPTSGLVYYNRAGFINNLKASDAKYLNLYTYLAPQLGYGDKSYIQAADYKNSIGSNYGMSVNFQEDRHNPDIIYTKFSTGAKMLSENTTKVKNFVDDFITNLKYTEKDYIISLLKKKNSQTQNTLASSGHTEARDVAKAKISKIDNLSNSYSGIDFSLYLNNLVKNIEDDATYNNLIEKLLEMHKKVQAAYAQSALTVVDLEDNLDKSVELLFDENVVSNPTRYNIEYDLEVYEPEVIVSDKTTSNYCMMVMNAPYFDHELAGAYTVLARIINEFTHQEIREKGGAYGGFASYTGQAETFLLGSYRDPNISKTFERFKKLKDWLLDDENLSQEKLEEGILQAIAQHDSPALKVRRCFSAVSRYFDDVTDNDVINFRKMILKTDITQLKRVRDELILPNLDKAVFSAFVNKEQYNKEGLTFKTVEF